MKAIAMNEEQGGFQGLTGLNRVGQDYSAADDWFNFNDVWAAIEKKAFYKAYQQIAVLNKIGSCASSNGNGGSTNATGINMSGLLESSPEAVLAIVMDLNFITGLNIWIDAKGYMQYNIPNGELNGSETARSFLISAIENPDETVRMKEGDYCYVNMDSKSISVQNTIEWNSGQVVDNISGTSSDLNKKTNGFGMFFLHELGHTRVGGKRQDLAEDGYSRGKNISFTNQMRSELSAFYKSNFGDEQRHSSLKIDADPGFEYYPYSERAMEMLKKQQKPSGQYIRIRGL